MGETGCDIWGEGGVSIHLEPPVGVLAHKLCNLRPALSIGRMSSGSSGSLRTVPPAQSHLALSVQWPNQRPRNLLEPRYHQTCNGLLGILSHHVSPRLPALGPRHLLLAVRRAHRPPERLDARLRLIAIDWG